MKPPDLDEVRFERCKVGRGEGWRLATNPPQLQAGSFIVGTLDFGSVIANDADLGCLIGLLEANGIRAVFQPRAPF